MADIEHDNMALMVSGLETISKTSAASTEDMSIITSGLGSEVSDEFQVRKGLNDELRVSFGFPYQPACVSSEWVGTWP